VVDGAEPLPIRTPDCSIDSDADRLALALGCAPAIRRAFVFMEIQHKPLDGDSMDKTCKPGGALRLHRGGRMRSPQKNRAAGEAVGPGGIRRSWRRRCCRCPKSRRLHPAAPRKLLAAMDGACRFYGDSMEMFHRWRALPECVTMIFCKKDFVATRIEPKLSWQTHL
jgi:hypothetical protein